MKIYLVRHGESEDSAKGLHQRPDSPLTKEGLKQAGLIAKRFKDIEIDVIFTSPFTRAKQLAEVISKHIDKPIEYSDLLVEIKRPTEVEGKKRDNPEVVEIKDKINKNYHDPNFRYSDEETFTDLKTRVYEMIKFLENLNQDNVLLVTHGTFAQMLLALFTHGRNLTSKEFLDFKNTYRISKAGLNVFEYSPEWGWNVETWNDQTHL